MTFGWDVESEIYEFSLRGREMHSFAEDKTKAGRNDICGGGVAGARVEEFYEHSLGFHERGGAHLGGNIVEILQISFKRWKREEV